MGGRIVVAAASESRPVVISLPVNFFGFLQSSNHENNHSDRHQIFSSLLGLCKESSIGFASLL